MGPREARLGKAEFSSFPPAFLGKRVRGLGFLRGKDVRIPMDGH